MKIILASVLVASSLSLLASPGYANEEASLCKPKLAGSKAIESFYDKRGDEKSSLSLNERRALETAKSHSDGFAEASKHDDTLFLDECGVPFYKEEIPAQGSATPPATPASYPLGDTFNLSSRPGSSKTIYLDFTGMNVTNTAWNASTGQSTLVAAPYSVDTNPGFSSDELANVQEIWKDVAQDYASFDVNVTTKEPTATALNRSNSIDQNYGLRALVTGVNALGTSCGCGGIAYLGITGFTGSNFDYYSNAWVFADRLYTPHNIAQAASHEIGHNLSLEHDGASGQEYYSGQGIWGPLMGASYNRPLTQWSKGEYAGANNGQDDLAIIGQSFAALSDDHGNARANASSLVSNLNGTINNASDIDMFKITAGGASSFSVTVPDYTNLDLKLSLLDASGNVLQVSDPPAKALSDFKASGLDASLSRAVTSGVYYLKIEPVGLAGVPGPYTSYGAVGNYNVKYTTTNSPTNNSLRFITLDLPNASQGEAYQAAFTVAGGTAPYGFAAQGLPAGLTVAASGAISGKPTQAGSFSASVTVTDAAGASATQLFMITVEASTITYEDVIITSSTSFNAVANAPVNFTLTAQGGAGYFTWRASNLPPGLQVTGNSIVGVPATADFYSGTITVTSITPNGDIMMDNLPYTLNVKKASLGPKASFVTQSIKPGKLGITLSRTILVKTTTAVKWRKLNGTLPPGLRLKPVVTNLGTSLKIVGKPKKAGVYKFKLAASNKAGTSTRIYSFRIKR